MDYDKAVEKYLAFRNEIDEIEREAKVKVAAIKQKMSMLETWVTLKAEQEGLKTVPTQNGTAYWSTHHSCSVAEPSIFFDYVRDNQAWDLIEKRASKLAVKSFIDESGNPPPGVNFSSYRVFNVRQTK
jgi:phage-related tail fiber protein